MIFTRAHVLVLLLGCNAGGPLLIAASRSRTLIARPVASVGRIHAKLTPVDSFATMLRLVDDEQLQLGELDVRGDIGPLRDKSREAHPVLAALRERVAAGSKPGARTDNRKIALAIEGGGMRGAVGAGMVAALHELGFSDAFDVVYGSSAGALVGAYFVSDQLPRFGTSVYYECLGDSGKAFINPVQLVRCVGLGALQLKQWIKSPRALGPPVLNLDYLLIDVMQNDRPLDWERFWARNQHQPLRVLASGLETQRPAVLGSAEQAFSTLNELATCLRASMLLPGITGPPMHLPSRAARGEPLADAVLTEPIPYRAALAEGCTHVLVLRTKADGKRVSKMISLGEALIARRYFGRKFKYPEMLRHMLLSRHKRTYTEDILLLNEGAKGGRVRVPIGSHVAPDAEQTASAYLMPLALPVGSLEMGRLETRRLQILQAIQRGFIAAYDLLAPEHIEGDGSEKAPTGAEEAMRVFPDALVEPAI